MGLFSRLKESLQRTKEQLVQRFDEVVRQADTPEARTRPIDVDTLEALEEILIGADVGVGATAKIVEAVREKSRRGAGLRDLVKQEISQILATANSANGHAPATPPTVMMIVGVNGTGKTTTVGKLANYMKQSGRQPLVCAADTFRAAAVEQLEIWAKRADVDIVRAHMGSDPAAVVFDAISSGKARGRDPIIIDTAGRLHTRVNLMHELDKIRRIASREIPGAPHEVLLVLDAKRASSPTSRASTASSSRSSMAPPRAASPSRSPTTSNCRSASSAPAKPSTISCPFRPPNTSTRCSKRSGDTR
jgi:fused signal recognition particle receptor